MKRSGRAAQGYQTNIGHVVQNDIVLYCNSPRVTAMLKSKPRPSGLENVAHSCRVVRPSDLEPNVAVLWNGD